MNINELTARNSLKQTNPNPKTLTLTLTLNPNPNGLTPTHLTHQYSWKPRDFLSQSMRLFIPPAIRFTMAVFLY